MYDVMVVHSYVTRPLVNAQVGERAHSPVVQSSPPVFLNPVNRIHTPDMSKLNHQMVWYFSFLIALVLDLSTGTVKLYNSMIYQIITSEAKSLNDIMNLNLNIRDRAK